MLLTRTKISKIIEKECIGKYKGDFDHAVDDNTLIESVIKLLLKEVLINNEKLANYPSYPELSFKYAAQLKRTEGYVGVNKKVALKWVQPSGEKRSVKTIKNFEEFKELANWEQTEFLLVHMYFLLHNYLHINKHPEQISEELSCKSIPILLLDALENELFIAVNAYCIRMIYYRLCKPLQPAALHDFIKNFLNFVQGNFPQMRPDSTISFPCGSTEHASYLNFVRLATPRVLLRIDDLGLGADPERYGYHTLNDGQVNPRLLKIIDLDQLDKQEWLCEYLKNLCIAKDSKDFDEAAVAIYGINVNELDLLSFTEQEQKEIKELLKDEYKSLPKQVVNNCPLENYMAGAHYRLRKVGTATSTKKTDDVFFWLYYKEVQFAILEHPTDEILSESEKLKKARDTFAEQLVAGENNQSIVKQPHETQALDVPKTYDFFTGRKEKLAQLEKALSEHSTVIIAGLPGMGKTQLAIQYANNVKEKNDYDWIIWLDAQKDLMNEFRQLAAARKIKIEGRENTDIIKDIYVTLKKALIVIDNAKNYEQVEFALPKTTDYPSLHILITSRSRDWGTLEVIKLEEFKEDETIDEAIEYLKQLLAKKPHLYIENDAKALVSKLGRIPLAITQAAAYIFNKNKPILDYLNLYKRNKKELLEKSRPFKNDGHPETICISLHLALQEIKEKSQQALILLKYVSFFASNHIPLLLFQELLKTSELEMDEVISLLNAYSLLEAEDFPTYYKMHPLVQEIIQLDLNQEEEKDYIFTLINTFSKLFPNNLLQYTDLWSFQITIYQHALKIIEYAAQNKILNALTAFSLIMLIEGFIEHIALVSHNKDYLLAHALGITATNIYQSLVLNEFDIKTKQTLDVVIDKIKTNLEFLKGRTLIKLGKEDEAITILTTLLESNKTNIIKKEVLLFYLGDAYSAKNETSKAEQYYLQASEQEPDAVHELGRIRFHQGKFEETETLFRKSIEQKIKFFKTEFHPQVARTKHQLGYLLGVLGNYQEGIKLIREAIEIELKVFGHTYSIISYLSGLGDVLFRQGNYKEALEQFVQAANIEDILYDENNYEKSTSLRMQLSHALISMSYYYDAYFVLNKHLNNMDTLSYRIDTDAYFILKTHLKNEDTIKQRIPDNHRALYYLYLGKSLSILEYFKAADNYFADALALFSKSTNSIANHNCIVTILYTGEHYIRQRLWKEAKAIFEYIFMAQKNISPYQNNPYHPVIAFILRNLALVQYQGYGQTVDVLDKLNNALEIQRKAYQTDENAEILITRRELLRLQLAQAKSDNNVINKIIVELTNLIGEQKKVYAIEEHAEIAASCQLLALCKFQIAAIDEAIIDQEKALSILQKVFILEHYKEDHSKVIEAKDFLFELFYQNGDFDKAIAIETELAEVFPNNVIYNGNLACLYHVKFLHEIKVSKEAEKYYQQAEAFFKKIMAIQSVDDCNCDYAVFLFKHQRYPDALTLLKEALIKTNSNNLRYFAIEFIRLDEDLQSVLKGQTEFKPSTHFIANYLLVRIYSALKMPSEAEAAYKALQALVTEKNEPIYCEIKEIAYKDLQSLTQKLTSNPVASFSIPSQPSNTPTSSMQQDQLTNVSLVPPNI